MADGSALELQRAMNARLVADVDLQTLLGSPVRIFQDPPTPVDYPYAVFGTVTENDDSSSCGTASDVMIDIEIYSVEMGFDEIKPIASQIRRALNDADLTLASQRCVLLQHRVTRHTRGTDPPTKRTVLTFHAKVEELI